MQKLPVDLDCPIDNVFHRLVPYVCEIGRAFSLSANDMTTVSLIFGVIAVIGLVKQNALLFVFGYMMSYFFDCVDGAYARRYNMVTQFGDWYDHVKDVVVNVVIAFLLIRMAWKKGGEWCRYGLLIILMCVLPLSLSHLNLMEIYHERDPSIRDDQRANQALRLMRAQTDEQRMWSDEVLHQQLREKRWFGTGSYIVLVSIVGATLIMS